MFDAFMDGNGGVDNGRLDDFAFDHRLYLLIDVVVRVFASYGRAFNTGMFDGENFTGGLKLEPLGGGLT